MRISKKYLKELLEIYEEREKELKDAIKSYENHMETVKAPILARELEELCLEEAQLQGRIDLCSWLIMK